MAQTGQAPILVTGAPRSGTTIIGRLLALPHDVGHVYEPMNVQIGLRDIPRQFWYVRAGSADEPRLGAALDRLLAGHAHFRTSQIPADSSAAVRTARRWGLTRSGAEYQLAHLNPWRRRWLLKDPMASFSSEWIHRRYHAPVVVTVRHPAPTIASYLRLGWRFSLTSLMDQPELMDDHLAGVLDGVDPDAVSALEEGAWLWRAYYAVLGAYVRRNDDMHLLRHETFSLDPLREMEQLYGRLGLRFTPRIREQTIRYTGAGNPTRPDPEHVHTLHRDSRAAVGQWRAHFDDEQLRTIRRITEPESSRWYGDPDW